MNNKIINMNNKDTVSQASSIFYTNSLNQNNNENINELSNSIIEDQFERFKKRNHYLRKSVIAIDSKNRLLKDNLNSIELQFNEIGFLMTNKRKYYGQLFIYLPGQNTDRPSTSDEYNNQDDYKNRSDYIRNNSEIFITDLVNVTLYINNINSLSIQFDPENNAPIYNISYIENEQIIQIFSWEVIQNLLPQYVNQEDFLKDNKNRISFFSIYYTTNINVNNPKIDSYYTIFKNNKPRIFLLQSRIRGFEHTSYFKVILGKTFSNIYKMKLLDIALPEIIFNINNDTLIINNLRYAVNSKIRFMMFDEQYLINNIDYVGARVKYDFFLKEAVYDIPGFINNKYKFDIDNFEKYPNFYVGNDIYSILYNILNKIDTTQHFLEYTDNNIFEVAYFFLIQFNLFYNTDVFAYYNNDPTIEKDTYIKYQRDPSLINRIFYVYTSEVINNNTKYNKYILRERINDLAIQNPLMYFNDFLLYVNTETFTLQLGICNWMDKIILNKQIDYGYPNGYFNLYCKINNIDERIVGYIQQADKPNPDENKIFYIIGIYVLNSRFKSDSIINQSILALYNNNSTDYIENTVYRYLSYDRPSNTYYYRIYKSFLNEINHYKLNTDIFHYNSTIYIKIDEKLILSSANIINQNYISYILILGPDNNVFNDPESIVNTVIYSRFNINTPFIMNTVNSYIGPITYNSQTCYAYIMYTYNQIAFAQNSMIYKSTIGNEQIGNAKQILDIYYNIDIDTIITNFIPGTVYLTMNNNKQNYLLKKLNNNNNYLAAYSSNNMSNFRKNQLIINDIIYSASDPDSKYGIINSYEPIGVIHDVQFELILDSSIYSTNTVNYNESVPNNNPPISALETVNFNESNSSQTQSRNYIFPQTIRIPLDNIRIIETKTQSNTIINYTGKPIHLNNNNGTQFTCTIVEQPTLAKNINMFVFILSLKIPNINIGTIYTQNNYIATIDNTIVGTGYSIYFAYQKYSIIIEKANNFQLEYLQNYGEYIYTKDLNSKFIKQIDFLNRNYSINNPTKTNMTGIVNYDLIPYYEVSLSNGLYTDEQFINEIERSLNQTKFTTYDYYQKILKTGDLSNNQINNPNYEKYRFKVLYDITTKKNEIKSYKVLNSMIFTAIYNPITPFIFFIIEGAAIDNNKRIYIEVLRDVSNSSLTNEVAKLLNREFTTRVLPIYKYEVRIISPVLNLQNIQNISENNRILPDNITNILEQIKLSPFNFRTLYPNLKEKMKFIGQTLINMYNNSNSYTGNGNINNNVGLPCNFVENELVIVIDNIYFNYESYKIGRITTIEDKTSNDKGNYSIVIQLCGQTEVSQPIYIGDIIYGFTSDTIGCIVPYEWGTLNEFPEINELHNQLPTEDIIRLGYKNYIKYLYKFSKKEYLLDYIQQYNLQSFVHYNPFFQNNKNSNLYNIVSYFTPYQNWPLIEIRNCYIGFEVPFNFPISFIINQDNLVLNFLKKNNYCLCLGTNPIDQTYDTPKDILGYSNSNILNINDYIDNKRPIPWKNSFDNTIEYAQQYITKMYMTYGSDNILQNKMYIELLDVSNYNIGDTIYLKNTNIRPIIQRNLLDIYRSTEVNIKNIFTFEIYLTFLSIRLAFIKSGIPISMGANDYLGLLRSNTFTPYNMWQAFMMSIPNSMNKSSTSEMLTFFNLILENFGNNINNNMYNNLDESISNNIKDNGKLTSDNICLDYAYIINKVILDKILPWFIDKNNILLWTKGHFNIYLYIIETYIDIGNKNIWRFELEILDNFIFKRSIHVKDKNNNIIGKVTYNSLYQDSEAINNTTYILYIQINKNYDVLSNLSILDYIYSEDSIVKNRIKTKPILVTDTNKYIYLYDTYLKFKTIVQIVPDNSDTINKCLNMNIYNNINSVFYNLYNLDTQNITSFKNGYYLNLKINEQFSQMDNFLNGRYRIIINMLDNKNLLNLCFDKESGLGLINSISDIKNKIINLRENASKDIIQIRKLLDIFQLLVDLSPINTVMIDLDFTQEMENNIHKTFEFKARVIDNIFNICGSLNSYLENTSYANKFIYGDVDIPSGDVQLYFYTAFNSIYNQKDVLTFKSQGTIEQNMCNLSNIYQLYSQNNNNKDFNHLFDIFSQPSNFVIGSLWVPINSGDKYIYIITASYNPDDTKSGTDKSIVLFNKNILENYIITINVNYIDQQRSINVNDIERNELIQTNIIESISEVKNSNEMSDILSLPKYTKTANGILSEKLITYRIFKMNLKFSIKYNVNRGCLIQVKDYYTTLYKVSQSKIRGTYKIYILKNWVSDKQFVLKKGYTIYINYGSNNTIYQKYNQTTNNFTNGLNSFDIDDIYHEQMNIINDINVNSINIEGKTYIELTLNNPIKYEFKSGIPVIIMFNPTNDSSYTRCELDDNYDVPFQQISDEIRNDNSIITNCLATQNIIVNNEWYTKIYYQSEKNLDIYGINNCGIKGINNLSKKEVYITGMKGFCIPNIGFQQIERNYYNSSEVTIEMNQKNKYIKPVPNNTYKLENIQKVDSSEILDNTYDLPIPGYFETIYCNNTPDQLDEWIDYYENIQWFFAFEIQNKDINDIEKFKNIDLFQNYYQTDLTAFDNILVQFDKLCTVVKIENTGDIFEGYKIYKIYFISNIKNIVNNFFYSKLYYQTLFSNTTYLKSFDLILSTNDKIYNFKMLYFGLRESIDCNYSNNLKKNNFHSVTIKGRYQGFGGTISFDNKSSIFDEISFNISDIKKEYNTIELDLHSNNSLVCSYFRNNNTGFRQTISDIYKQNYNKNPINNTLINPIFSGFAQTPLQINNNIQNPNEILEYYDIFPSKFGYLGDEGVIYKKRIYKPQDINVNDYIYLCFKNIESNITVEQNSNIDNDIIFAKIYTKIKDINNYYLDYTNYEIIFDLNLLPRLSELEVYFLTKSGNLVNFNNLDINFQLEIHEYVERVKNINTHNGMVF